MKQYTATANDEGVRLSRFVQSVTRDFPTSFYTRASATSASKSTEKRVYPKTASRPATSSSSTSTTNSSRLRGANSWNVIKMTYPSRKMTVTVDVEDKLATKTSCYYAGGFAVL